MICVLCFLAFTCCASAKQNKKPIDPCDVNSLLAKSSASRENKAKVESDLMLLRTSLLNFGYEGEFSRITDDIYRTIPEKDLACRLAFQNLSCVLATRSGAIDNTFSTKLLGIVKQRGTCDQAEPLKTALQTK